MTSGNAGYVLLPEAPVRTVTGGAKRHQFPHRTSETPRFVRFWAQVDQSGGLWACWPWLGPRRNGYGMLWHGGKRRGAHRIAFELTHGRIPAGLDILHTCDNPPCCNPTHLWTGTARDNLRDAARKGRIRGGNLRGETSPNHKLTWAAARDIRKRQAAGESQHGLAREYGVSQPTIHFIVTGRTWRELTDTSPLRDLCPVGASA